MKCPRCGRIDVRPTPACPGCGFTLAALDAVLGTSPAAVGRLDDGAGVLAEDARAALEHRLVELGQRAGGDLFVVTRKDTGRVRPSEYAFWLFNRRPLAQPHHRGLLVLLVLDAQRVETEVGYGWESVATERETGRILDEHVVPRLRARDYAGAMTAAVDALGELLARPRPGAGA